MTRSEPSGPASCAPRLVISSIHSCPVPRSALHPPCPVILLNPHAPSAMTQVPQSCPVPRPGRSCVPRRLTTSARSPAPPRVPPAPKPPGSCASPGQDMAQRGASGLAGRRFTINCSVRRPSRRASPLSQSLPRHTWLHLLTPELHPPKP